MSSACRPSRSRSPAGKKTSRWSPQAGDVALLQRMREAVDNALSKGRMAPLNKLKLQQCEGKLCWILKVYMSPSNRVKECRVKLLCGQELFVSPANLSQVTSDSSTSTSSSSTSTTVPWPVGSQVQLKEKQGVWTVVRHLPSGSLALQNDFSSAPAFCDPGEVSQQLKGGGRNLTTFLREYQHLASEFILNSENALVEMRPGSGKTLVVLSSFLRLVFDENSRARLRPGEICLVVTEAHLVDEVWNKQAHDHGIGGKVWVAKGTRLFQQPPDGYQLVIISYQSLCLRIKDDPRLWKRPVTALFVDEAHRLCGQDVWNSAVQKISSGAGLVAGLTGTLFPNDPGAASNLCKALCLHKDLHDPSFWKAPHALQKACKNYRSIYVPGDAFTSEQAPRRPLNPPWKLIHYQSCTDGKKGTPALQTLMEVLGCSRDRALEFQGLSEADKKGCVGRNYCDEATWSSKTRACIDVLCALFEGGPNFGRRHSKIILTVMYIDTLHVLNEILRKHFNKRLAKEVGATFELYLYYGGLSEDYRKQQLETYLARPCGPTHLTILLLSLSAGKNGLNITNGEDSPTAHIEFEQAALASDRYQLQRRIDRDSNVNAVQLVVMTGTGTPEATTIQRQEGQARKQKVAGCDRMMKALFPTAAEQRD